ncbi:glucosyltransferase domain-containing protein, partial [Wohlfahrtiimonas larvae]
SVSVLFSIFPFLFYRSHRVFFIISIIGVLGTLTTYQSASGVYWVVVIMLTAKNYFYDQINIKRCVKLFCIATLAYIIAVAIFRFCIYTPRFSHISNEALALPELFNGVIRNIKKYLVFIYSFVAKGYIGLYIIFLLLVFSLNVLRCQENQFKVISMICLLIIIPIVLIASIGIPIFLSEFPIADRYMLGFNVLITICALVGFLNSGIIYRIFYLLFAMQLIAYGNIQGNIIGEQWSYEKFRLSMALSDLSPLIGDEYALSFGGNPVFRASFNVNAKNNSFIYGRHKNIISLLGYPGYWQLIVGRYIPIRKGNVQCDSDKGKVIFSSVYHNIYQKNRCFSVIYKTVGIKQSSVDSTSQASVSIMSQ